MEDIIKEKGINKTEQNLTAASCTSNILKYLAQVTEKFNYNLTAADINDVDNSNEKKNNDSMSSSYYLSNYIYVILLIVIRLIIILISIITKIIKLMGILKEKQR